MDKMSLLMLMLLVMETSAIALLSSEEEVFEDFGLEKADNADIDVQVLDRMSIKDIITTQNVTGMITKECFKSMEIYRNSLLAPGETWAKKSEGIKYLILI